MYKVIIVDDETWICKLIRKIVNWESLGFCIVDDTGDGLVALQLIKEHKPDLVITDIRMPSLDGMGLIRKARELKIDAEFIIISGYSDFEYARSALTYDAFSYILKPVDKNEFQTILLQVKEKIDQKYKMLNKIELSEAQLLEQTAKQIVMNKRKTRIEDLNRQFGTCFQQGAYSVAVLKQDSILKDNRENPFDNTDLINSLSEWKQAHRTVLYEMVAFRGDRNDQVVLILNYEPDDKDNVYQALNEILLSYKDTALAKRYSLTVSLGGAVTETDALGASYREAVSAMKLRVYHGVGRLIAAENESHHLKQLRNIIDIREEKKITMLIDVFDIEGARKEISGIFKRVDKEFMDNPAAYHFASCEMLNIIFAAVERKGVDPDATMTRDAAVLDIDDCFTKAEVESYLFKWLSKFEGISAEGRQENGAKLIGEIKSYISAKYMSDISLDDVAKRVCLNSTYLSEVFKKKTGENFSEYVINYRIDIAKELLKDIRYKVVDVSSMVGYKDSKYFSRLFKKKVGVNPTEYRNFYI